MKQIDIIEKIARDELGWRGSKYLKGQYPWDIGVTHEDNEQKPNGEPIERHGLETFFSKDSEGLTVFGPKNSYGSIGAAGFFNPFTSWHSLGILLERKGITPEMLLREHYGKYFDE